MNSAFNMNRKQPLAFLFRQQAAALNTVKSLKVQSEMCRVSGSHEVFALQSVKMEGLMLSRCYEMIAHVTKSFHNVFTVEPLFR